MINRISDELSSIEEMERVRILYACESGSRAWGFASQDSDYDVRFIYAHPRNWYLSIYERRDVIEIPLDGTLDINGWDLRKSLKLLRASNCPLLEWLRSPLVYRSVDSPMKPLLELSETAFLPAQSCHHYLSMARKSMDGFGTGDRARIKRYLYALRTVLCARWIIERMQQPPVPVQDLLAEYLPLGQLRSYIDQLMEQKARGSDSAEIERSPDFEEYLTAELNSLSNKMPENQSRPSDEAFDSTFREMLDMIDFGHPMTR
jgi:uncharacterized protein